MPNAALPAYIAKRVADGDRGKPWKCHRCSTKNGWTSAKCQSCGYNLAEEHQWIGSMSQRTQSKSKGKFKDDGMSRFFGGGTADDGKARRKRRHTKRRMSADLGHDFADLEETERFLKATAHRGARPSVGLAGLGGRGRPQPLGLTRMQSMPNMLGP